MSNTKNLANLAAALDDGTSGQVLQSTGSGGVQFADSSGSGVTVHANQAAMLTDAASADEGSLHYENNTNKLYVKQTSGFYLLASITNASPTIDSFSEATGGASANNLTAGGTFTLTSGSNTVVTINATEPDLETISYSATVTSGTATDVFSSPSFPVTNQSSNVFTLTPVTSGSGGTVTIRFDASDGTNVANVSHSFEIAFAIADSHYTSLLMTTDGSAGDNNDITDSSSSHTITVNGDAHAGTFSPYRHGGYSVYFDYDLYGTSTIGLRPKSTTEPAYGGSGDLTVECWIYPTTPADSNASTILDQRPANTNGNYVMLQRNTNGQLRFHWDYGWRIETNAGAAPVNQWTHVAIVRSSGVFTMYINGSAFSTTYSNSGSNTNSSGSLSPYIGLLRTASAPFWGYIKDMRFVSSAVYTQNFTPPSEPLTAISGTTFLSCHKPYALSYDTASTTNIQMETYSNSVSTKPFGPYDYNEYSESTNGGSVYFDGSGDYITTTSTDYDLGTSSAFTVELWYYFDESRTHTVFDFYNSSNAQAAKLAFTSTNVYLFDGSANILSLTRNQTVGAWEHFCWTRDASNNHTFYINGSQVGTSTAATSIDAYTIDLGRRAGSFNNTFMKGYVSDVRIVKGTAVYSGNFTPPTGPLTTTGGTYPSTTNVDTSITASNTTLLLSSTDAHVIDKSQTGNVKLLDNTASTSVLTSNSTPPYIGAAWAGTSAVSFDGTGDRALITGVPDLGDDFTIEAWIYSTSTANDGIVGSIDNYQPFAGDGYWNFFRNASNKLILYIDGGTYTQSTSTVPLNQWVHVACTRSSGTVYYYIDGTRDSTTVSNSLFLKNPSGIVVGSSPNNNYIYNFNGYIQDLRLTVGKARYTAADESSNIPSAPLKG